MEIEALSANYDIDKVKYSSQTQTHSSNVVVKLHGLILNETEVDMLNREREKLMEKLIEAEEDGQSAAKHATLLRDLVRKFRQDSRISQGDRARFGQTKHLLLEKLADFEMTNRTLQRSLREQHKQEAAALRLSEHRDVLMKQLADTDISNEKLRCELLNRDRLIAELRVQVEANRAVMSLRRKKIWP